MKALEVFTTYNGANYVNAPRCEVIAETRFDAQLAARAMTELFDGASSGIRDYAAVDDTTDAEYLSQFAGQLCFDEMTEILTDAGWQPFHNALGAERVMTLNSETGVLEWQAPRAWHVYPHIGDLYQCEGRDVNFAVTGDHRQWAKLHGDSNYRFHKTSDLLDKQFKTLAAPPNGWVGNYPTSVTVADLHKQQTIANKAGPRGSRLVTMPGRTYSAPEELSALAKLCVYYATEGTLQSGAGGSIVVYGDHEAGVKDAAVRLGLPVSTHVDRRSGVKRMAIGGGQPFRKFFEECCGKNSIDRNLPSWIKDLPKSELSQLWNLLVATDGHRDRSDGEVYCTVSSKLVDTVQEILLKLGYATSVSTGPGANYPVFYVRKKTTVEPSVNKSAKMQKVTHSGYVFCVTTDNGIVLVRRNGIPQLSGNCYLSFGEKRTPLAENAKYLERIMESAHGSVFEHSSYSVLFFGIDRATTHELVRHRAGTAISQVSQRFVDDEHLRFVLPYEYNNSPKLIAQFEKRIDRALEDYRVTTHELREVIKRNDGESATEYRKRIQSCSREVLPNCTEAPIIVTANVRAWRHIFSMRCSAHADVRVRRPMIELLKELQMRAPNLFCDFEYETLPDGTQAASSRYPKV